MNKLMSYIHTVSAIAAVGLVTKQVLTSQTNAGPKTVLVGSVALALAHGYLGVCANDLAPHDDN